MGEMGEMENSLMLHLVLEASNFKQSFSCSHVRYLEYSMQMIVFLLCVWQTVGRCYWKRN